MSTINDQKGLMVRFKLDESSGTTAKDSSGNSRHGTLGNFTNTTTCWTHEKRDGGLDFGQATTAKCDFAFTDPGDFTTMMAFVAWDTESAFPRVIHLGDNDVPYQLLYLDHAGGDTGNALAFGIRFGGGTSWFSTDADLVEATGLWHHYAVTYDASSRLNNPIFYIDGKPSEHVVIGRAGSGDRVELTTDFGSVGQVYDATNRGLNGLISDARVYNRILTPDEIYRIARFLEEKVPQTPELGNDFVINQAINLDDQHYRQNSMDNTTTVDKVPFSRGLKGPSTLRGRNQAYAVTVGGDPTNMLEEIEIIP
tara:strand:- start:79 stop:1008 length:930 start_codon:yes stop_codon:yes gene_type:complete